MPPIPSSSPLQDHLCRVVSNRLCGEGLYVLRLKTDAETEGFTCQPGQFVMLDLPEHRFQFRRPFSVLDTPEPSVLDIYYKVVGFGTRLMAALTPGETMRCLGPLGNGFPLPESPETALYIGGGIGIAPLYMMAKTLLPIPGACFYGVRGEREVGLEKELGTVFKENLHIATDDGSYGFHGNVVRLLEQHGATVATAREAYICGPTRMMEAVAAQLQRMNPTLRAWVSLEEHMPCGTGACTGCVVPRTDRYLPAKVCTEGPVFDARQILWQGEWPTPAQFCEESPCPI